MIPASRFMAVFLLAALFAACGAKREDPALSVPPPRADSLISPGKMALILADVHVAEAAMTMERNAGNPSKADPAFYYKGIFEKYHITAAVYERNLSWYRQHPDHLLKVYDKVTTILENRRETLSPGR